MFSPEKDFVSLIEAFSDEVQEGQTLSFKVGPFHNPMSGKAMNDFHLLVTDKDGGHIMSGDSEIVMTQPA